MEGTEHAAVLNDHVIGRQHRVEFGPPLLVLAALRFTLLRYRPLVLAVLLVRRDPKRKSDTLEEDTRTE